MIKPEHEGNFFNVNIGDLVTIKTEKVQGVYEIKKVKTRLSDYFGPPSPLLYVENIETGEMDYFDAGWVTSVVLRGKQRNRQENIYEGKSVIRDMDIFKGEICAPLKEITMHFLRNINQKIVTPIDAVKLKALYYKLKCPGRIKTEMERYGIYQVRKKAFRKFVEQNFRKFLVTLKEQTKAEAEYDKAQDETYWKEVKLDLKQELNSCYDDLDYTECNHSHEENK